MGCFLSCFRGRPDPASRALHDPLVRKTRLGDAFLDDHHDDGTAKLEESRTPKEGLGNDGGVDDDLRREANYLKSCGAISETPPEILKASNQVEEREINECNETSNNAQETKEALVSEIKDYLSEGFNSDGHDGAVKHDQDTDEGTDDHVTEVESAARSSSQERSSGQIIRNQNPDPSDSPFPTPLVLRDDIQTPGFTTHQGNFKPGKRGRASKQFLYPVLRPIENKLQWTELRDESSSPVVASHPPKRRYLSADSTENEKPHQQTLPGSVNADAALSSESAPFLFHGGWKEQHAEEVACPEDENVNQQQLVGGGGVGELLSKSSENGKHGVASLSCWLKTTCADGEGEGQTGRQLGFGSVDLSDVPVFVASGLNWDNENNPTPMLPKAWDGNGIPNTTTKYKEDQRVNWHATPFEERLMKVLSDEKPHHQRKISGKLIHLEEDAVESPASATASS
ncbi:protein JASON-like [Triticum urartu]|uniref:Protein JASON n=1 Tax=Triticum urartu TaxID=4572 RepID=A0A8R7RD63_TRIUA|nr:protein JASON [Triticum urartu]XP_048549251.1 protein JASON-like [Triticum urartu]